VVPAASRGKALIEEQRATQAGSDSPGAGFNFAGLRLEPDGTLYRGTAVIHLPPKELAALRLLLDHAGLIVTPLQLRYELWGDVHVTDDSVAKCVSSLRARLGGEDCIQTVYKRGYRLSTEVRRHRSRQFGALPRLAILPFEIAHGFPAHLGLGVVEEAIDRIVAMRPAMVSVIARDSVSALARNRWTALKIGETLRADLVLTGSLHALPAHFRLRARMVQVEDGTEIWVEDLLVERGRIGGLASELANRMVFRLGEGGLAILAEAVEEADPDSRTRRREAYDNYLRARHESQTYERHRMQDSLQHLLRATELDPSLISAQVDLAHLCCMQAMLGFMSPGVAAENVRRAAAAIPAGSEEADAVQLPLGWVHFHVDRDLKAAMKAFSRCAHVPDDGLTLRLRAMFALSRHRFDEAITLLHEAIRQDPFSLWLHARLAWALHLAGRGAESVEQIHRMLERFPGDEGVALYGAMILCFHGELAQGVPLAEEFAQRHPYFDLATAMHAYALACAGRRDEARADLERLQWLSRERFVLTSFTPPVHVVLGNNEAALQELRIAEQNRCPWFFQMLADPRLKPLEAYPEFGRMQEILPGMEAAAAAQG
jgi:DNA-binding winged helix-turn-helix (wHTH) protein/tetratricopeptide (TPR) repeat protein